MLRAVLGVCGVGLIAFGIFGGQTLENMHSGISGLFIPDTVVENVAESVEPSPATETVIASSTGKEAASELVVEAAVEARQLPVAGEEVSEEVSKVLEIQSSSKQPDTEITPAAPLTKEVPAGTLATASIAIPKVNDEEPLTPASKDEGVEVVLNSTTGVPPSDTLFVLKERVNLREGPSTNHPVVLQLDKGQELMEFKRDGRWVHVGAYGTAGKIGWVHQTLVGDGAVN